jgi:hypothetical protein
MLIVHVALEMWFCCVAVSLMEDGPILEVASGGDWVCDNVVL